jgi:hypothetical protein
MAIRALLFLFGLTLVACTEPSSTAPVAVCPDSSVAEPFDKCSFPIRCASSEDCPLGTACLTCPGDGSCADIAAEVDAECPVRTFEEGAKLCLLPPAGSIGLVDGFEVNEFRLKRKLSDAFLAGGEPTEEDKNAVYEFTAPGQARFVHCALFGCPPEVASVGDEQYIIANFDRCVLAHEVFEANVGFFDLTRADYGYPQNEEGQICPERPGVTSLQVGCWAYGRTSVLGATLLLPVAVGDEIFDYTSGFEQIEAGSECTMAPCRSDELSLGGACNSACRPLCVSGLDCPVEDENNCLHEATEAYSYVGVCLPPSEE